MGTWIRILQTCVEIPQIRPARLFWASQGAGGSFETMLRLRLLLCALFVAPTGCAALRDVLTEPTNDDAEEVYATPTGDGSHYIAIFSEPETPAVSMARRWKREATKVCEGDYLVMSENAAERRSGGQVESKVHEGWVRCLSPDVALEEASEPDKTKARDEPTPEDIKRRERQEAAEPGRKTLRQRLADRQEVILGD